MVEEFLTHREELICIGKSWFDFYFNYNLSERNIYFVVLEKEFKNKFTDEGDIYNKVYSAMYESFYDVFRTYDINEILGVGVDGIYFWRYFKNLNGDICFERSINFSILDESNNYEFIGEYEKVEKNTKNYIYGRIYKDKTYNIYLHTFMFFKMDVSGSGISGYKWDYEEINEDEVKELLKI